MFFMFWSGTEGEEECQTLETAVSSNLFLNLKLHWILHILSILLHPVLSIFVPEQSHFINNTTTFY